MYHCASIKRVQDSWGGQKFNKESCIIVENYEIIKWFCPPCCPKTFFSRQFSITACNTASVWQFYAQLWAWIESYLKGIFCVFFCFDDTAIYINIFFGSNENVTKSEWKNSTFEFKINSQSSLGTKLSIGVVLCLTTKRLEQLYKKEICINIKLKINKNSMYNKWSYVLSKLLHIQF